MSRLSGDAEPVKAPAPPGRRVCPDRSAAAARIRMHVHGAGPRLSVRMSRWTGATKPWRWAGIVRVERHVWGDWWQTATSIHRSRRLARTASQDVRFPAPARASLHGVRIDQLTFIDDAEFAVHLSVRGRTTARHRAVGVGCGVGVIRRVPRLRKDGDRHQ